MRKSGMLRCRCHSTAFVLFVFLLLGGCAGRESDVTLLYTTDTHGRIISQREVIGLDLVAALKKKHPEALLVDSGDFLDGLPAAVVTQGKDVTALMKQSGYQAAALGNHEFTYGTAVLEKRMGEASAAPGPMLILSANVRKKDGAFLAAPSLIVKTSGGKICLFGLSTPDTKTGTDPRAVEGLDFLDPVEVAGDMTRQFRAEGCGIVVALTHLGSDPSVSCRSSEIAALPGIDAVLDGHSHLVVEDLSPGRAALVSSGKYGEHVGMLTLVYDTEKKAVTRRNNRLLSKADFASLPPDPVVAGRLAALEKDLQKRFGQVVAECSVDLPGAGDVLRTRETALGDLVADALRAAGGADIAIMNAGGIREGVRRGPVTLGNVLAVLPYNNNIMTLRANGREIRAALERGFAGLPGTSGGFPQLSGMKVEVKADNPPGRRVVRARLENGEPLEDDGLYTLALTDFTLHGGDGYPVFAGAAEARAFGPLHEAFTERMREKSAAGCGMPAGRIVIR